MIRSRLHLLSLAAALGCLTAVVPAGAQTSSASSSAFSRAPFNIGYLYDFDTPIDGGGEVSSHFFHASGTVPVILEKDRFVGVSAAYHLNRYAFSGGGPGSFAALAPWEDVHTIRLSAPVRWRLGRDWNFFGIPTIRFVGENGAGVGDALSGGGLAGVSYRFGERLTLGPGFGYITQIEDDASIFPVVLVDWKITESLSLSTGPSVGATLGPGLSLNWRMADRWQLSVGARYEKLRFRLDESSSASPGGVGEDRSIPAFLALSYQASENWRLALIGGVNFGNELKLDDVAGGAILDRDYDPAPFAGLNAAFSF